MSQRKVKYKENHVIERCPKCNNNTEFTVQSEQVAIDGCEIWAECICGFDPTSHEALGSFYRLESVMGGCDDENCQDAILCSWNESVKDILKFTP